MYDDIAFDEQNPRPGVIINKPHGDDVYQGVPKDYTGKNVNIANFFAVILGNKTAINGGSGKVVDSSPNDFIFIFYTDHGAAGVLGMPNEELYGKDLIDVLKKKHAQGTYKAMVFYLEACESGSIFDGLLTEDMNIYATTAANAVESSYATYCPGDIESSPPEFFTCLGDLYSVAWLEDSDIHDLSTETLEQQFKLVKRRVAIEELEFGSHVMQYGSVGLSSEFISSFMGTNPENGNLTSLEFDSLQSTFPRVSQRDADLLHFQLKFQNAPESSEEKIVAEKRLSEEISQRKQIDDSMKRIAELLFGAENGPKVLATVRPTGRPLVDDWDCFKSLVQTYKEKCGKLSKYGLKYMRAFANMCNFNVDPTELAVASAQACAI